jgi:hypothetical protein
VTGDPERQGPIVESNWEGWAVSQKMLQDGQVWENDQYVFQVDKVGKDSYRVVLFTSKEGNLHFVGTALYTDMTKLCMFLDEMKVTPTSKFLSLRRR